MGAIAGRDEVAKKKSGASPKQYGTLIRVSTEFAEALKDAVGFEKTSVAAFADTVLLPVVRKRYRDGIIRAARKMEGGEN